MFFYFLFFFYKPFLGFRTNAKKTGGVSNDVGFISPRKGCKVNKEKGFLRLFSLFQLNKMSFQVNFNTHGKDLKDALDSVINEQDDTNWLIYAFDKGTYDLRVQETGCKS